MRYPGRFLKNRTPPTVDRRGVPVGLSILLLVVIVVIVVFSGEEEAKCPLFLLMKKLITK